MRFRAQVETDLKGSKFDAEMTWKSKQKEPYIADHMIRARSQQKAFNIFQNESLQIIQQKFK